MALHDPVQDEINRQIRASLSARRTPQERELLRLPRTEDITNIPPEGVESVLERADRSLGRVFTTTVKGESARDKAFRLRKEGGFRRFLAERKADRARREAQQSTIKGRDALAQMRERQGRASLITANAALAKARTGGTDGISEEALRLLGLDPNLAGKISRPTARTAATLRAREETEAGREKTRKLSERRIIDRQRRANVRANQARSREARLAAQAQLSAIDKQLGSTDPADIKQVQALFKQLVGDQGNALPEDQVQFYKDAARDNLPADATDEEIAAEATKLAEDDGYSFLP
jgi:hypothetical protein